MKSSLQEIDAVIGDEIDEAMFKGDSARPDIFAKMFLRLGLPQSIEWRPHDGLNRA